MLAAGVWVVYGQVESRGKEVQKAQPGQAAQGGWRAHIDPATGKLRETDDSGTLPQTSVLMGGGEISAPIQLARGGVAIRLGDSQMVFSVARIGPDGKLVTQCVKGKENAEAVLKAPVSRKEARDDQ
jgi:hypothetical protein